jgi:hypothetical protein
MQLPDDNITIHDCIGSGATSSSQWYDTSLLEVCDNHFFFFLSFLFALSFHQSLCYSIKTILDILFLFQIWFSFFWLLFLFCFRSFFKWNFFFKFNSSTLHWLGIGLCDFFSIWLSWSHDLAYEFEMITVVTSVFFWIFLH